MARVDELRAELELVELEAELAAAKKKGAKISAEDYRALKDKVREARRVSREAQGR